MKKLLVLAGGSKRNEAWGEACVEHFKNQFDSTDFIRYDHWSTGEPNLAFEAEIAKIAATAEGAREEEVYVFAKSIGSILALKAVAAGVTQPTKCVFFGMPFSVVKDTVFKDDWSLLENFKTPALAFHNDNDPTANYELAKEKLTTLAPNVTLTTLTGDTHDYLDFGLYQPTIDNFLNIS
jgi:predicted alpha/beta hydrolase family esterase